MTNLPPDQVARLKIEHDLDINLLVEAGAGSGKTTSLVKRLISLIASGKVSVAEIAAITFTRKAAAELRERFQTELERAYRRNKDTELQKLFEQALEDIDQCYMGTIHSFCAKLLRERPVEAGIDPNFVEIDTIQEQVLQQQAWDDYLLEVKLNQPELLGALNEIGVSPLSLRSSYVRLSSYPDVNVVYTPVAKPDLAQSLKKVEAYVYRAIGAIPQAPPSPDYDKLQKSVHKAIRLQRYLDINSDANIVKVLSCFTKELKNSDVVQKRWNSKAEAVSFRDEYNKLREQVVCPVLSLWHEYCHYHLMRFIVPAVKRLEALRCKKSQLNFQDLLTKTAELLNKYPEVRQYFQRKYRCLLVDEFQDTDPVQAQIMLYLTGGDTTERDWRKLVPVRGSLFVVGDPKQSIYRFRRADIDTYNLVRDIICQNGGESLELTANFRSVSVLGDWFNTVFSGLFPCDEGSSYQAKFSALNAMRSANQDLGLGVKVLEIPAQYSKKDDIVEADAEYIASYIKWSIEGNLQIATAEGITTNATPKDFMILLRYKDCMDVYARALEKYGIPVTIAGGGSLSESHELCELHKLLTALADPGNQVALIAVLRGLFFGLSDTSLYAFKQAKGTFCMLNPVADEVPEPTKGIFVDAFNRLKTYYQWSRDYAPTVALEKIIIDLGIVPYTLSGTMGKSRCGYVFQLLELLHKAEVDGVTDFTQMVAQFALILEFNVEEELSIYADEQDAVRLMNLHKAKGLEAPVVFLAHPYKKTSWPVDQHTKFVGDTPEGYFLFAQGQERGNLEILGQPQGWHDCEQEELKYLEAEETRLIYVAATRARNLLVVSKSLKDAEMSKNPWAPLLREIPSDNVLEKQAGTPVVKAEGSEEITSEQFEKFRRQTENGLQDLAKPTYLPVSPSRIKSTEHKESVIGRERNAGAVWGTIVHAAFEHLVKGTKELEAVILRTLADNGEPEERLTDVLRVINNLKRSELWAEICDAEVKLTEVPFSLKVDKNNPLYRGTNPGNDVSIVLSGVIDLVIKRQDGWVIVDYKTDHCENDQDVERLSQTYRYQVQTYCQVWQALTKEKVVAGQLYFASLNLLKSVV